MLKRPHYIALGLVVLMTLIILNLPSKTTARLKSGIGSLFVPLFGLANSTQQAAGRAADDLTPRSELIRQNETLRQQNQELRLQAARTEGLIRENDRLRALVKWQQQKPAKFKLASVVLREPANWWRAVQIDLGTRDGMKVNLPVLTGDGALVGRIASVSLTRSQVVLLGDPNCKVAARVDNAAHDSGVISGSGPFESEFVDMGYLSRNAALKPGQNVWTSGLGGVFPKDILIGKVVDMRSEDYGLYTVARVKLAGNLSALEEVWVMLEP
ncbi:MAG TPA: rod shape-determining protein MreC [Verrucomicrobiae bacterium]|nr:rod shape-determining protein MreC [Verrucomicrobiae bacterium]